MNEIIAERRLMAIKKSDGTRINVSLRIGKPYLLDDQVAECSIEIIGLFNNLVSETRGIDTFQAMQLALQTEDVFKMKSNEYDFYYAESGEHYFDENAPNIEV